VEFHVTLDEIVARTPDLPSLPAAAMQVMREAESSTSSAASIAQAISRDQALSARVLRLANSAYYGLSRKVGSLPDAVVVLGMRCVRNLCLVAATFPWMTRPLKGYALGPRELWTLSFGTGLGAQALAKANGTVHADTALTAGLLHAIGKVALSVWLEDKVGVMAEFARRAHLTFDAAERTILGYDHCQVGGKLGEIWNLPADIVEAIRHHHAPTAAEPTPALVDCVHVAHWLMEKLELARGIDVGLYAFDEGALARLGIAEPELDRVEATVKSGFAEYAEIFADLSRAA
jgi:HD-like signal output (HDOD) protein